MAPDAGGQPKDGYSWEDYNEDEASLVRVGFVWYIEPEPKVKTPNPKIENLYVLAEAVKQHEGFYPGSVAFDNNNPGALRRWPTQVGTTRGFAIFPSYEVGYQALLDLLLTRCGKDWTLYRLMSWYAPSSDNNNPYRYASILADKLGVSTSTKLENIYCL